MKTLALLAAAAALILLAWGRDPFSAWPPARPLSRNATIRGTCRYVGREKPTMLDPMPGMGCAESHLDGTLDETADHTLGDCVVSLDLPWTEPTEATATELPAAGRFRLAIERCAFVPRIAAVRGPVQVEVRGHPDHDMNLHVYRDTLAETVANLAVAPGAELDDVESLYFPRPGTYLFRSDIGASYFAVLHVFHHRWFDVTTSRARAEVPAGGFAIYEVPPGEYGLTCVHEAVVRTPIRSGSKVATYASGASARLVRRVRVAAGETVTVDFDVPARGADPARR